MAAGLAGLATCTPVPLEPGYVALDRGAGVLLVLDRELVPRARMALEGERVVTCQIRSRGGDLGILVGLARGTEPLWRLERVSQAVKEALCEPALQRVRDLERDDAGDVLLVKDLPLEVVWRLDSGGGRTRLFAASGLVAVAGRAQEVLIGGGRGELVLVTRGGAVRTWGRLAGRLVDLAPVPMHDGWWALFGSPEARLVALRPDLGVQFEVALEGAPFALAVPVRGGAVWAWGATGARSFDEQGHLVGRYDADPQEPLTAFLALADGALAASDGALIELTRSGRVRRTQGGFSALASLTFE